MPSSPHWRVIDSDGCLRFTPARRRFRLSEPMCAPRNPAQPSAARSAGTAEPPAPRRLPSPSAPHRTPRQPLPPAPSSTPTLTGGNAQKLSHSPGHLRKLRQSVAAIQSATFARYWFRYTHWRRGPDGWYMGGHGYECGAVVTEVRKANLMELLENLHEARGERG